MRTPVVLSLVGIAFLGIPVLAPAYYVTLMLPFMAYGVVLLGLNLLFGYTGLVSFGHALFIGIGAYTGAVLTTYLGVRHIELIVEAFAVVVIGGLGSMRGAFVGALVVGILRSVAISVYPELEMLLIYLIVIGVLIWRPRGLFGAAAA